MTLEHFLNGPNRTKFGKQKNIETPGKKHGVAIFDLQNIRIAPFFKIRPYLKFVNIYSTNDVTLMPFTADLSEVACFPRVRMCQVDNQEGAKNVGMTRW